MESRCQLRRHTRGSSRPPTSHGRHNPSDGESSDEDDDDIPACKRPSVSPSKRLATPAKRPSSDATLGGIALYPGSKKPRHGYNMAPVSRGNLAPDSKGRPLPTIEAPSPARSPSIGSEDDVCEALISRVNDAFRNRQTRQTQDYMGDGLRRGPQTSHGSDEARSGEPEGALEEYVAQGDDQDGSLPLAIPTCLTSSGLPNSGGLTGVNEHVKHGQDAAPEVAGQKETGERAQVDAVSLFEGDIWDVPKSPRGPNARADSPEQRPKPVRKRGRPPKFSTTVNVTELPHNNEPPTGKRGRPRKHHPQLPDETDEDYVARLARLRKKPIPRIVGPEAQSHQQPSHDAPQPSHQTSDLDSSQPAQGPNLQLEIEPAQDAVLPGSHAELAIQDGYLNARNEGSRNNDILSLFQPTECNDEDDHTDAGTSSEPIDGLDSEPGSERDVDQFSEDSFSHDVDVFNSRRNFDVQDDEVFEGPSDGDVLAIHLDHQPLRRLCKLLGHSSWTGAKGNWQWRHFDYAGAESTPARALLPVLAKLDRLYQATPKAPDSEAQNTFIREHANMLGYYFHKIKILVEHIRTQRLESLELNQAANNVDPYKRKRMTRDLVLYVIPMLTHVLSSAWGLGGEQWSTSSFTSTATELLGRTLGWIVLLHNPLLRELERCPLEEKPEDNRGQGAWHRRNAKRAEIAPLIDEISQVIAAAPDQLAEAQVHAKKESQRRQLQLRREQQLKAEQKAAEEARKAEVAERKKRSLLSIHGIHYRLGTSATASSRPSPSPALGPAEWSVEEQRLLFLRIQESFPACPDLNTLRWELNKTTAQTVAMTEHLLGKMLAKVLIGYSAEERAAELRRIMRGSEVTAF